MHKNKIFFLSIILITFFWGTPVKAQTCFAGSETGTCSAVCVSGTDIPGATGCTDPNQGECCSGGGVAPPSPSPTTPSTGGLKYTLLEKIPGYASTDGSDLPGYVKAIYRMALMVVVLSALFMLSVGGFMYLTSAGNTAAMSTAKSVIFDSIIGLIIALVAWLLLNTINPDLVNVTLNGLSATKVTEPMPVPVVPPAACPSPSQPTAVCCPAGIPCQACSGCVEVTGVTNKGCGLDKCYLDPALLQKIKNITGVTGWRITESWPPTVKHLSKCHQNGTCADINNSGGPTDPATIKKYFDAFKAAGLVVLYESKDCAPYIIKGVTPCQSYSTMTNLSSFHVQ